jgi:hypothetical protein
MYATIGTYYSLQMTVCCPVRIGNPTRTTDSHLKSILITSCCIHTVYLLMMGLDTPETCSG